MTEMATIQCPFCTWFTKVFRPKVAGEEEAPGALMIHL